MYVYMELIGNVWKKTKWEIMILNARSVLERNLMEREYMGWDGMGVMLEQDIKWVIIISNRPQCLKVDSATLMHT